MGEKAALQVLWPHPDTLASGREPQALSPDSCLLMGTLGPWPSAGEAGACCTQPHGLTPGPPAGAPWPRGPLPDTCSLLILFKMTGDQKDRVQASVRACACARVFTSPCVI